MTAFAQRLHESFLPEEGFSPSHVSSRRRTLGDTRLAADLFAVRKHAETGVKRRDLTRTVAAAACAAMAFVLIVSAAVLLLTIWIELWIALVSVGLALAVAARLIMREKGAAVTLNGDSQESDRINLHCSMW